MKENVEESLFHSQIFIPFTLCGKYSGCECCSIERTGDLFAVALS